MYGKEKHAMDRKPVLLKQASNKQELNWENILITINKDRIINFEISQADHLTKFILNPVEGSRSAPTRSSSHGLTMRKNALKALSICSSKRFVTN